MNKLQNILIALFLSLAICGGTVLLIVLCLKFPVVGFTILFCECYLLDIRRN